MYGRQTKATNIIVKRLHLSNDDETMGHDVDNTFKYRVDFIE